MSVIDYLHTLRPEPRTRLERFVTAALWRIKHAWMALIYGDCEYF